MEQATTSLPPSSPLTAESSRSVIVVLLCSLYWPRLTSLTFTTSEYANKAVENSGTALAIRGKDGVVFAVEKIVTSKLYEKGANRRIFNIDSHVGMAAAGLVTDARQLASIARDEASSYRQDYGSAVPLPQLTQSLYIPSDLADNCE